MKRSSPHASGVLGLWRRLGLGFVVRDIGIFSGSVGEPGNRCPLSLPTSRRCPSPFRECDVERLVPRPAIRPLWAFPAATRMEPGSVSPEARMHPRLWRHRGGRMARVSGGGDKIFRALPPSPASSSGLARGSAASRRPVKGLGTDDASRITTSAALADALRIPGPSPRMTKGVGVSGGDGAAGGGPEDDDGGGGVMGMEPRGRARG